MQKILIIDDDKDLCFLLNQFLCRKGYEVTVKYSGEEALEYLQHARPDLIICDLRLEDIDGITLLGKVKQKYTDLPVIIITGHSDIKTSALALKQGAFDYVVKPLVTEQILLTIHEALSNKKEGQASANIQMADKQAGEYFFWGDTESFRMLNKQVQLVGPTDHSVIIYGEDGTGKKSIANEIHKKSKRSQQPFVVVKAGALLKDNALEEVFGSETTAANGEKETHKGVLEQANGGTLFIVEAQLLPLEVQEKLLQVIRRKRMRRVGGTKDINVDVRVIISSNNILWSATRNGKFREDLYHKLNDFNIVIAPLRQRREDIPVLADHFLKLYNEIFSKSIKGFTTEAYSVLKNYDWHDNIRELKNVIKKVVLLNKDAHIGVESLPAELVNQSVPVNANPEEQL
ncbi:sigma-54-dependent Fis family transcriptional regulator [Sediminibacterium roseum]|uniref:Sigma-54-dependent Fis family transcriptional regulator n=1 Tax=Sediminibacterium roseum TaxID=1978412 RepID=A0ABW9ZXT0_9BACT|nr:sigma-54 dependent transcriptional regulator [Sediminibacterium roseum]NCI50517.1 sigma-54-dependent Fis family transcriptional regulator [Sediminibacterium roseum]